MAKDQANRATKNDTRSGRPEQSATKPGKSQSSGASSTAQGDADEDHLYGLASVLYHCLQGVTASRKYAEDARRAGIDELVEFFEECAEEGTARAKQAKELLVTYSEDGAEDAEDAEDEDETEDETEDED
ncbi:MAG TPA: hypothetical protein VFK05_09400 [Polyangiaceae bacterium]|nr:hypothetical protein [Polyangiaceae bacterium]